MKDKKQPADTLTDLQQFARLVNQRSPHYASLLHTEKGHADQGKLSWLYHYLLEKETVSDVAAAKKLYDKGPQHKAYQMLKSTLRQRLLRGLLLMDVPAKRYSAVFRAQLRGIRQLYGAQLLVRMKSRKLSVSLWQQTLRDASDFQLVELQLQAALALRQHYSQAGDHAAFLRMQQRVEKAEQQVAAVRECMLHVETYDAQTQEGESPNKKLLPLLRKWQKRSAMLAARFPLAQIKHHHYLLCYYQRQLEGKLEEARKVCRQAYTYCCETAALMPPERAAGWLMREMGLCHDLRETKAAKVCYAQALEVFGKEGANYLQLQELNIRLQLLTGHYSAAHECYAQSLPALKATPRRRLRDEMWQLFNAYMHLLKEKGELRMVAGRGQFKHQEMLTKQFEFRKDKKGLRIPLLIMQVFYWLGQRNEAVLHTLSPHINFYIRQHLNQQRELQRSAVFLQLLKQHLRFRDRPALLKKKAAPLLQQLRGKLKRHHDSAEWIDYETLWDMLR